MTVEAINQTNYRVATANIGLKNVLLDDYTWSKEYSPETNTVDIRSKVALDAGNYTIKNDGTVISGINLGQPQPIVILNKNENLLQGTKPKPRKFLKSKMLSKPKNQNQQEIALQVCGNL